VIRSFKHAGLEKFFRTGSKAGIQPNHAKKLRVLLTALDAASNPLQMDGSGWGFHALSGVLKGHWAVSVNGNWRITFTFRGEDAEVVDYLDYH
jgi:proteic killer suppression protein